MASAKKASRKISPKKSGPKKSNDLVFSPSLESQKPEMPGVRNPSQTFNLVVAALVLIVLAMGYVKFKYLLVPAVVDGGPIFSWQYVKALNQTAGKQVIDQLIVEKLIAQEAEKQKIELTQEEIDVETKRLDDQFQSVGGLDAFLSSQGLKKSDIQKQLELNLKVQKIVADRVNVTPEEVDQYYTDNTSEYRDIAVDEAKAEIKQMLSDQALQAQVGTWIQDLRAKAKITINLPNAQ